MDRAINIILAVAVVVALLSLLGLALGAQLHGADWERRNHEIVITKPPPNPMRAQQSM